MLEKDCWGTEETDAPTFYFDEKTPPVPTSVRLNNPLVLVSRLPYLPYNRQRSDDDKVTFRESSGVSKVQLCSC
jgi:hypothetical protein